MVTIITRYRQEKLKTAQVDEKRGELIKCILNQDSICLPVVDHCFSIRLF